MREATAPPFFCPCKMDDLETIVAAALAEFAACGDPASLENCKARFLGRTGQLTELLKALGKLPAAERPAAGARINAAKEQLEAALNRRREELVDFRLAQQLAGEALDVSLPGRIEPPKPEPVKTSITVVEKISAETPANVTTLDSTGVPPTPT